MSNSAFGTIQNQVLTNLMRQYVNEIYIFDKIFPMKSRLSKKELEFINLGTEHLKKRNLKRAKGSESARWKPTFTSIQDEMFQYSIEAPYEWEDDEEEVDIGIRKRELIYIENQDILMLNNEIDASNILATASNYTYTRTLSGTDQWNDYANSTPIEDIDLARFNIRNNGYGVVPNTIVMGYSVYDKLKNHPDFLERAKYNYAGQTRSKPVVTPEIMANILDVDMVYVGWGVYDNNGTSTDIFGKWCNLIYINPSFDQMGKTFSLSLGLNGYPKVEEYNEDKTRSTVIRNLETHAKIIRDPNCGGLLINAVA